MWNYRVIFDKLEWCPLTISAHKVVLLTEVTSVWLEQQKEDKCEITKGHRWAASSWMKMTKKRLYVWDSLKMTICHSLNVKKSLDIVSIWKQRWCSHWWRWSCSLVRRLSDHRVCFSIFGRIKKRWILFMKATSRQFQPLLWQQTDDFDETVGRLQPCSWWPKQVF